MYLYILKQKTMENLSQQNQVRVLFVFFILTLMILGLYIYGIKEPDFSYKPTPMKWAVLPTKLEVEFKDCTKDTFNILLSGGDMYEPIMGLKNGDLYYWMGHEETPNSGRNVLASYVKKYTILEQGRKEIIK